MSRLAYRPAFARHGPGEVFLRLAPLSFDASAFEIWTALLNGSSLAIFPPGLPSPAALSTFLHERQVTVAWLTSGLFQVVAEVQPEAFGGLRQLLTGGDVVPADPVRKLLTRFRGLRITNGYGPTENGTFSTVHHMDEPADVGSPVPIGRPIPGTSVHILDASGRRSAPGEAGDLHVAGDGLAQGYIGARQATAKAFGRHGLGIDDRLYRTGDLARFDAEGRVLFLGRADRQVKIRGHRVELDEVQRIIMSHPAVTAAYVTCARDGAHRRILCAVCISGPGGLADVRAYAARQLASYQLPNTWAQVGRLPLNGVGKVDIAALDQLIMGAQSAPERPGSPESLVRACMARVLGTERFKPDDDFFDVGGDSLSAIRLIGLLRREYRIEVPIDEFLANPTLRRLSLLTQQSAPLDDHDESTA